MRPTETVHLRELRTAGVLDLKLKSSAGINVSYDVWLEGGLQGVFKPRDGEKATRRPIAAGTYYLREAVAHEYDRLLSFGLVPPTVIREVQGMVGSLQEYQWLAPWMTYGEIDDCMMAVLDYTLANTDRHPQNWMTQSSSGRPAAIDNGLILPTDHSWPILSLRIARKLGHVLAPKVVELATAVDLGDVASLLKEFRIELEAIDGCLKRLEEVRSDGRISGRAWPGHIEPELR